MKPVTSKRFRLKASHGVFFFVALAASMIFGAGVFVPKAGAWSAPGAAGRNSVAAAPVAGAAALPAPAAAPVPAPAPADDKPDPKLVEQGKARYQAYRCFDCHGKNGEGTDDAPDLIGTHLDADGIAKFLAKPSADAQAKGMPTIATDSPDSKPLVAFVLSIKKAN